MKDRYVYPAVFTEDESGLAVEFPDLPGCYTCGQELDEAFRLAREALGLHLHGMEQDGEEIPPPSRTAALMAGLQAGQSVVLVEAWMPLIRGEAGLRAVKKTLTIPKWLADLADEHKVNFSHVLQEALKSHLGLAPAGGDRYMRRGVEPAPKSTSYPLPKERGYALREPPPDED